MCRAVGPGVLAHDAAGIAASAPVAFREASVVILPARNPNMSGCSIKLSCCHPIVGMASRGARRGASGRRYRATSSDMQRLKLLVEPHPAILRDDEYLYGMQEVRGSNPLSSTIFPVQRHISILKMIFDFLHCKSRRWPLTSGFGTGVLARQSTPVSPGRQPVPPEGCSPGAKAGANGDRHVLP